MIPRDYVTAWRAIAPWVEDAQVEQDLVVSRALVEIFSPRIRAYMDAERHPVTRAMFERNLDGKLRDPSFGSDMSGLLAAGREWHALTAAQSVTDKLLSLLPGEEWQGRKLGDPGS